MLIIIKNVKNVLFILSYLAAFSVSYTMEQKLSTSINKEAMWNAMELQVNSWTDKLGMPIDSKIKDTVIVLNLLGFKTNGSCEGHLEQGFCFPWVSFSIVDDTLESLIQERNDIMDAIEAEQQKCDVFEPARENSKASLYINQRDELTDKIHRISYEKLNPLRDLINKFYTNSTSDCDRMLMLSNFADYEYWLMSIAAEQQIDRDEVTKLKKLQDYYEEMDLFTQFLKDYYLSDFKPL